MTTTRRREMDAALSAKSSLVIRVGSTMERRGIIRAAAGRSMSAKPEAVAQAACSAGSRIVMTATGMTVMGVADLAGSSAGGDAPEKEGTRMPLSAVLRRVVTGRLPGMRRATTATTRTGMDARPSARLKEGIGVDTTKSHRIRAGCTGMTAYQNVVMGFLLGSKWS